MTIVDTGLIKLFDDHLFGKRLNYSASIIGGTAILLLANCQRPTGDIDALGNFQSK